LIACNELGESAVLRQQLGTYDELLAQNGRFAELVAGDQPLEAELA